MTNPGKTKRQSAQESEALRKKRVTIRRIVEKQENVEKALRESEEKYRLVVDNASEVIVVVQDGMFRLVNPALVAIMGLSEQELKSTPFLSFIHPNDRAMVADFYQRRLQGEDIPTRYIFRVTTKDGSIRWVEINVVRIDWEGRPATLSFLVDITERKQAEEEIRTLSLTDDLTGLNNRRAFFVLAKQQLRIAKRTKREMFLFYADIDGLKRINDMFGHQGGDAALIDAVVVLKKTFRESDIIARIGGDEFVVLTTETTIESKEVMMKRLQENLEVHNLQENRKYRLYLSIGVAFCDSQHPRSLDDLIAQADKLMYDQKGERKKKR